MSKGSSASTDVYALAATIYYCITGRVPPDSAERQYDAAPLESPTARGADITPKQEKALLQALEIQQSARTQSIQAFLDALHASQEHPPVPDPPPKFRLLAAAALVLVLCAGLFLLFGTGKQPSVQPESKPALQVPEETIPQTEAPETLLPESEDPADKSSEEVSLTILAAQYGSQTADWWSDFVRDFEKEYPKVDLAVDVVSWNDIYTVVNTRIANGEAPDILNIDVFADYQADGLLLPVQKYMSAETYAKFYPRFLEQSSVNGKVWAVPDLASARAMYYNSDILNAAGVEVPTTWEELEAACKAIKAYDSRIHPWGVDMTTDEGQACFAYYTLNNGGGFVDEKGQWILNCPENVEAVQFITSMVKKGLTNADPITETRYSLQDMFAAGKVAMMIGPNQISDYCVSSGINYGIAPIPVNEGKQPYTIGVMDRFMAFDNNHSSAELAAITCFFDFFYEDARYAEWTTMEGFLPATSTGNLLPSAANPNMAVWNEILASATFYPATRNDWFDAKMGAISVLQETLLGGNPKTLLDALQRELTD